MSSTAVTPSPAASTPVTFRTIVCGIDGSASDAVVIRQAAALAGPTSKLELVSVVEGVVSESARIMFTRERARRALRQASDVALDTGVPHEEHLLIAGWGENGPLLERCESADLLVIGSHGGTRVDGILAGRTCAAAVHAAPCPVLVARPVDDFPGRVLLADDGRGPSDEAAALARSIAALAAVDTVIAVPHEPSAESRSRIAEHVVALREASGREPVVVPVDGSAAHELPEVAERLGVSLLVLGSRNLRGVRALSSVSERVAHQAKCSVLVVRH